MGKRPKTLPEVMKSELTPEEKAELGGQLAEEQVRDLETNVVTPKDRERMMKKHHKKGLN